MKRIIYLLTITMLLSACSYSDKQLINLAESMMDANPDSALYILSNVEDENSLTNEYKARYWIATATAHYNQDQSLTEDSMILFAVDYYRQQTPVDSTKLGNAIRLAADYYWWTGKKGKTYRILRELTNDYRRFGKKQDAIECLTGLTTIAFLDQNLDDMKRYADQIIEIDSTYLYDSNIQYGLAYSYFMHGNDSLTKICFERAIASKNTSADSVQIWKNVIRSYAHILIEMGQIDTAIEMNEQILAHYNQSPQKYSSDMAGLLFSQAYAWLLKGDNKKAQQCLEMAEKHVQDKNSYNPSEFYKRTIKMILDFENTGHFRLTDMANYVNDVGFKISKQYAIAEAKERSVMQLQKKELMHTVSRQRQYIFFLLLIIGLLVTVYTIGVKARKRKKLLMEKMTEMHQLNQQLQLLQQKTKAKHDTDNAHEKQSIVTLKGEYNTTITTHIDNLLYIEAVGNYVRVYYLKNGKVQSEMIRATSKQVEDFLSAYPMMVRCHRAFLVNLNQIEKVVSQQGVTSLIIRHSNEKIPVSRRNMAQIRAVLDKFQSL